MFSDFQYTVLMEIQKLGQTQERILKSIRDMERVWDTKKKTFWRTRHCRSRLEEFDKVEEELKLTKVRRIKVGSLE